MCLAPSPPPAPQALLALLADCLHLLHALPQSCHDVLYLLTLDLVNHFDSLADTADHHRALENVLRMVDHEEYRDMLEKKLEKLKDGYL